MFRDLIISHQSITQSDVELLSLYEKIKSCNETKLTTLLGQNWTILVNPKCLI